MIAKYKQKYKFKEDQFGESTTDKIAPADAKSVIIKHKISNNLSTTVS